MIRVLDVLKHMTGLYEHYVGDAAEDAFFEGWHECANRHKVDGAIDDAVHTDLEQRLEGIRALAEKNAAIPITSVTHVVGEKRAQGVVSAWEGLGRFSRECCGVEPLVLTKAWRLLSTDPADEVRKLYPEVSVDEEAAEGWYKSMATPWDKRCGGE